MNEIEEHFKPTGTLFILGLFAAGIVLLWASVYVILLSRGVTL
ncbi:MAG: cytochrome c oxidase subunit 2A [Acidimicrobiia bacterium]